MHTIKVSAHSLYKICVITYKRTTALWKGVDRQIVKDHATETYYNCGGDDT